MVHSLRIGQTLADTTTRKTSIMVAIGTWVSRAFDMHHHACDSGGQWRSFPNTALLEVKTNMVTSSTPTAAHGCLDEVGGHQHPDRFASAPRSRHAAGDPRRCQRALLRALAAPVRIAIVL